MGFRRMDAVPDKHRVLRFSVYELDLTAGELRKSGMKLKLAGQPLQVLLVLVQRPDEIVPRDELRRSIWPENTFIDHDLALKKAINHLRGVLGDSADTPRFIETIPRRGYRFIAPVWEEPASPPSSPQPPVSNSPLQGRQSRLPTVARASAISIALAAAIIFVLGRSARHTLSPPVAAQSRKVMLAVLPLDNLSGDSTQDYFSDGMTEELITQLGGLNPQRLGVIARASAMQYRHTNKGITQIGKELGVDYVLEGSARRDGGRVRITAQLIRVSDQTHVWAEEYDRDMTDVLTLQAEVARDVTRATRLNLPRGSDSAAPGPIDPEAHEALLKGHYYWAQLSCEGFLKARKYYQQAINKDPQYAMAYAGLADTYFKIADFQCRPNWQSAVADAKASAVKALELDSNLGQAHASLGVLLMLYDWDWPNAEKHYKQAIELSPNYEIAHSWYGMGLLAMGRREEARAQLQIAHQLDPVALLTNFIQGAGLFAMRQYDAAAGEALQIIEMYPSFTYGHGLLASIYEAQGRENDAVAEWLQTESALGTPARDIADYRAAYQRAGMTGFWREHIERARKKNLSADTCEIGIATLALGGETEAALQCTEQRDHAQIGNEMGEVLMLDPRLDQFRSQPRFQVVLRRVGLAH